MSSTNATVQTEDLAAVLDYLQGLHVILEVFHAEQRGREGADPILTRLDGEDWTDPQTWEPLRFQGGVGQGWQYVSDGMTQVRDRLLQRYTDAAL